MSVRKNESDGGKVRAFHNLQTFRENPKVSNYFIVNLGQRETKNALTINVWVEVLFLLFFYFLTLPSLSFHNKVIFDNLPKNTASLEEVIFS